MSKSLFQLSALVWITSASALTNAQVLSTPSTQPVAQTQLGVQPATGPVQTGNVEQTAWGLPLPKVTLPKVTMPKITMPKLTMPKMSSVTLPVKSGFEKVKQGTKKAWEGTKEMLTFGKKKSPANGPAQQKTSFWQRMIEPPESKAPQTVGEFMSQPRLKP